MLEFSDLFSALDATLVFFTTNSISNAFSFGLLHPGWYVCEDIEKSKTGMKLIADFNMANIHWLNRCSFVLSPVPINVNPLQNCFSSCPSPKAPVPVPKKPSGGCLSFVVFMAGTRSHGSERDNS